MPNYDTPPWFIPGALPRKSRFGTLKSVPPFREAIEVIPRSDWPELLKSHTGLRFCTPEREGIYDQDGRGSCASEACNQMVSVLRVFSGQPWVLFNPLFTYIRVSGGVDRGSTLDDNILDLQKYGACPESVWPRSAVTSLTVKPPDAAFEAAARYKLLEVFDIASIDECVTALLKGFPVYYGSQGHAKLFVRALDETKGLYVNSWGAGWGDGGYGIEKFASVNFSYGMFAGRSALDIGQNLPSVNA